MKNSFFVKRNIQGGIENQVEVKWIDNQEILDFMRDKAYKPMTIHELEKQFNLHSAQAFKALMKSLNLLEDSGEIIRTRNDRFGIPERMDFIRGRMQVNAKGFGFLIPEDREHPDVYIAAHDLGTAMHGDTVFVKVTTQGHLGGKMEGEVVRVIQRAHQTIVGTFQYQDSFAFILPDDKRIVRDVFVTKEHFHGALDGQKVVVEIIKYPEGRSAAEGKIIEVLGHQEEPGVDILSIIRKFQLPEVFPEELIEEAKQVPEAISHHELAGRRDLRDKRIVTIDGEDAKDLDDAVHVKLLPNGHYVLGVHIADVGYYVRENSLLDQEAYRRGCSVYLVDRVIPMLPHRLSNGICSLNPQVDRLTVSCEMEFDSNANRIRHELYTSVIRTTERMTYTHVRQLLNEEEGYLELQDRYSDLVDDFRLMKQLAMRLRWKRMDRGAIDFDFVESKILVDANGKPTEIVKRERSIAEMLIEEFMLAANETVAEHFHWLKVPFLYRIHENPDAEKLLHLMEFITNFGYVVKGKGNTVHPGAMQKLLEEIKDKPEAVLISKVMLRSMKQAKYDSKSLGHFGLATEFYSHFTSPIRRYPDLVIHRIIRDTIEQGQLSESRIEALAARIDDIARQSSERERVAVEAERETDALKKAEYMVDKIGQEFEGMISSVTNFGIFIELLNTVEGLIRLSDLTDDYYHYHERQHALIGERTSKMYRIGDMVKVKVARVNVSERTIDFEMVDMKPRSNQMSFVRGDRQARHEQGKSRFKSKGMFVQQGSSNHRKKKAKQNLDNSASQKKTYFDEKRVSFDKSNAGKPKRWKKSKSKNKI
jgi:ribonuclease R